MTGTENNVQSPDSVTPDSDGTTAPASGRPPPFRIEGDRALLFKALAAARAEFVPLDASQTAEVKNKEGKVLYSFDYADLSTLQAVTVPALSKHGLVIMQPWWDGGGGICLLTMLCHESGAYMSCEAWVEGNDWQARSSGLTYAKRYAWGSILGISARKDDDDGNKAVGNQATITPRASRIQDTAGAPDPLLQEVAALSRQLGFDRKAGEAFMMQHLKFVKPTDKMTKEELGKLIVAMTNELTERDARGKIK